MKIADAIVTIGCCLLPLVAAQAGPAAVTVSGYPACSTEQQLDDFISFVIAKDTDSMQAYLDSKKCVRLKDGVRVTILKYGSSVHRFAYKGVKLWAVSDALKVQTD
jgi:hypothetical protein